MTHVSRILTKLGDLIGPSSSFLAYESGLVTAA